jgi:cobalamin 5''-phosphate synthase/cobalamin synthase
MKKSSPSFFLMLGFFTRIPVPKSDFSEERFGKSMILLPLVGLVIGLVLALIQFFLGWIGNGVSPWISAAVLTGAYIFITGGLHFDGLADTCDGVLSGRTREQSLEIMKDSRIGVFGTLGLLMTCLLYFALFIEIPPYMLLIFPAIGRACCLVSASMAPYAREDGMGKSTSKQSGVASVISAIITIVGVSVGISILITIPVLVQSLISAGVAVLVTVLLTLKFKKKLGGVTGDTFGAIIEASSLVYIFVFLIFWRAFPY